MMSQVIKVTKPFSHSEHEDTPIKGKQTLVTIKKLFRNVIAYSLYLTGILNLLLRIRLSKKAVVLMYHRVLNEYEIKNTYSHQGIVVSKDSFDRQINYVSKHFHVVTLNEFVSHIENKVPFPDGTCLITFDDGWRDNFTNAFPILQKYQVPAVIFLTANYIGSEESFWQGTISRLLFELHRQCTIDEHKATDALTLQYQGLKKLISCRKSELKETISNLVAAQKHRPIQETERLIERLTKFLASASETPENERPFLTWDDIRAMASDGIRFGSHGNNHRILINVEVKETLEEIRGSKERLEIALKEPVEAFSYPNGDYDEQVVSQVSDSGYKLAFGTNPAYISVEADRYQLGRINIHEDMTRNIPMFVSRIARLW